MHCWMQCISEDTMEYATVDSLNVTKILPIVIIILSLKKHSELQMYVHPRPYCWQQVKFNYKRHGCQHSSKHWI